MGGFGEGPGGNLFPGVSQISELQSTTYSEPSDVGLQIQFGPRPVFLNATVTAPGGIP